jgi:hypothetical protein
VVTIVTLVAMVMVVTTLAKKVMIVIIKHKFFGREHTYILKLAILLNTGLTYTE